MGGGEREIDRYGTPGVFRFNIFGTKVKLLKTAPKQNRIHKKNTVVK